MPAGGALRYSNRCTSYMPSSAWYSVVSSVSLDACWGALFAGNTTAGAKAREREREVSERRAVMHQSRQGCGTFCLDQLGRRGGGDAARGLGPGDLLRR